MIFGFAEYSQKKLIGHGQSGCSFQVKTRFLQEPLREAISEALSMSQQPFTPNDVEFFYPDGILPARIPNTQTSKTLEAEEDESSLNQYRKWTFDEQSLEEQWTWAYADHGSENIIGFEESIRYVLALLSQHGPFIGIVGFSMGAALAAIVASLLEQDRVVKNTHFNVSVSFMM